LKKAAKWLSDGLPFVVYRHPNDGILRAVYQNSTLLQKLEDLKTPGFVFAPFKEDGDTILLTGDYQEEKTYYVAIKTARKKMEFSHDGREQHIKKVQGAIRKIEGGNLQKVVLSRCINALTQKSPLQLFSSLFSKYPMAFCYWWYHPKVGMWLGATPEQLLQYRNDEVVTTSLAGTLPVHRKEKPKWTSKEFEEQQMVTDYIVESLKGKVANLEISDVESHKAGRLWHLKSLIKGTVKSFNDLEGIIANLHPTPAVCGLPKMDSLHYILQSEGYDREYYTGYLGPIHLGEKNTRLFVNLRCLKYSSGQVTIYVGGGITADSNPESEWEETQYKSGTILEVL